MSLLDRITFDGAESGSMVMTNKRGHAMYLLRLPDRGEEGYHLYVIPMWPETEASIIRRIEEECGDSEFNDEGVDFVDIFWQSVERYYVGEFE